MTTTRKQECDRKSRSVWSARSLLPLPTPSQLPDGSGAFDRSAPFDSGSKLRALQTLRAVRETAPFSRLEKLLRPAGRLEYLLLAITLTALPHSTAASKKEPVYQEIPGFTTPAPQSLAQA